MSLYNLCKKLYLSLGIISLCICSFTPAEAQDGEFFTIQVAGDANQLFEVFVTRPEMVAKGRYLFAKKGVFVPFGKVLEGNPKGLNFPWSWHLDPNSVIFTESSAEILDGSPYQIEAELQIWMNTLGNYAPWGCQIVAIGKRNSVPLTLSFEQSEVGINPNNLLAVWNHKGHYSFTKYFGLTNLPRGIPLRTPVKINTSWVGQLNGKTILSAKNIDIIQRKRLKNLNKKSS